jgi:polyisoprenoid-binding protein YceI
MSQFFHVNPVTGSRSGPKPGPWRRDLPRTWRAALDLPDVVPEAPAPAGGIRLGPDDGTLSLRTTRTGAAAKAGHDLLIHVTRWEATIATGDDGAVSGIQLDADGGSLRVREGTGGVQALGDDDKANIQTTIDDEILKRGRVTFRSTEVVPGAGGELRVRGDLALAGAAQPIEVELHMPDDGTVVATSVVTQSGWGMTPYSILFGTLKVVDEIDVRLEATLPQSR